MPFRRAKYLTYGKDDRCVETREFLVEAGVVLDVRDIEKEPLSEDELKDLIGHLNVDHFLNPVSDSYTKYSLGEKIPERDKLIKMVAQDHTLLRRPIIKTLRLLIVGCDRQKIIEMLRLNGDFPSRNPGNSHRSNSFESYRHNTRRHLRTTDK